MRCSSPGKLGGCGRTPPPSADAAGAGPGVPPGASRGPLGARPRGGTRGAASGGLAETLSRPRGSTLPPRPASESRRGLFLHRREEDAAHHLLAACRGPGCAFCGTRAGLPALALPFVVRGPPPRGGGGAVDSAGLCGALRALAVESEEPARGPLCSWSAGFEPDFLGSAFLQPSRSCVTLCKSSPQVSVFSRNQIVCTDCLSTWLTSSSW